MICATHLSKTMEQTFNITNISGHELVNYEKLIIQTVTAVKLTEQALGKLMQMLRRIYQQTECSLVFDVGKLASLEQSVTTCLALLEQPDHHSRMCAIFWLKEIIFGISGAPLHSYGLMLAQKLPIFMAQQWNLGVLPNLGPDGEPKHLEGRQE